MENDRFIQANSPARIRINTSFGLISWIGTPVLTISEYDTRIFLNGTVYCTEKDLEKIITSNDKESFFSLEGLFSLIIVRNNNVEIITNRTNSHKVFYCVNNEEVIVSTSIDDIVPEEYSLDKGCVINFIVNNCLINEKTIFKGIKFFPSATYTLIDRSGVHINPYDVFSFRDPCSESHALTNMIQSSLEYGIKEMKKSIKRPILALSGGWDARSILFFLTEGESNEIESFSYVARNNDASNNTDADASKKLAESRNCKHQTVNMYLGDFIKLLENNASIGKCISAFCYELDALSLISEGPYTDIIFGDHIFGYGKKAITIRSKEDVLQQISMYKSDSVKGIQKYYNNEKDYDKVMKKLDIEVDIMFNKAKEIKSYTDKKDYLYFQQRVLNLIMPLRQMTGGLIGFIHDPYLNNNAIEVCQHIATEGRVDKAAYKKALLGLFPTLFDIPNAANSGRNVDWEKEITDKKQIILEKIAYYPNELEGIFPKKALMGLIKEADVFPTMKKVRKYKALFTAGIGYLRRRFKYLDFFANMFYGPHHGTANHLNILVNVLYIREYLEQVDTRIRINKEFSSKIQ